MSPQLLTAACCPGCTARVILSTNGCGTYIRKCPICLADIKGAVTLGVNAFSVSDNRMPARVAAMAVSLDGGYEYVFAFESDLIMSAIMFEIRRLELRAMRRDGLLPSDDQDEDPEALL